MAITRVVDFKNLPDWAKSEYGLSDNGCGKEWASYLVIEDGNYREVYSSAMEPEDVSFWRDLGWVAKEIERARKERK